MQGLNDVLGVMGEDARIDEYLGLNHLLVRPLPMLGESDHQALGILRDGVRCVANLVRRHAEAFAQSDEWDPTNATPAPSELSAENLPNLGGTPSEDTGSDKPVGDSDSGSSSSSSKKSESLMKVSWKELKEYQGQVGEKNWKALFKSFARSWGSKEDDQWAAEHRNRYDMTLFGKKYENVAGHETKVSQVYS